MENHAGIMPDGRRRLTDLQLYEVVRQFVVEVGRHQPGGTTDRLVYNELQAINMTAARSRCQRVLIKLSDEGIIRQLDDHAFATCREQQPDYATFRAAQEKFRRDWTGESAAC